MSPKLSERFHRSRFLSVRFLFKKKANINVLTKPEICDILIR